MHRGIPISVPRRLSRNIPLIQMVGIPALRSSMLWDTELRRRRVYMGVDTPKVGVDQRFGPLPP